MSIEYLREGGPDNRLRDIRFILVASSVDRAFVEAEVARLGLHARWRAGQPDR